jgi:hypothetical protein
MFVTPYPCKSYYDSLEQNTPLSWCDACSPAPVLQLACIQPRYWAANDQPDGVAHGLFVQQMGTVLLGDHPRLELVHVPQQLQRAQ